MCELPLGKKATRLNWIFKTKFGVDGEVYRY